jgi:protein SCO1/2
VKRLLLLLLSLCGLAPAAADGLPPDSLYQLHAALTTQSAGAADLDLYRGHPLLISMFYGSCPAACPMLITAMQAYESHLDQASRAQLRVLMVSFDAARDTPARLAGLAGLHRADPARWTFCSAGGNDARKIAALLGIAYRRQPDGSYDHSLLITLLDGEGRVLASTGRLVGDASFQARLRQATAAAPAAEPIQSPTTGAEHDPQHR